MLRRLRAARPADPALTDRAFGKLDELLLDLPPLLGTIFPTASVRDSHATRRSRS